MNGPDFRRGRIPDCVRPPCEVIRCLGLLVHHIDNLCRLYPFSPFRDSPERTMFDGPKIVKERWLRSWRCGYGD